MIRTSLIAALVPLTLSLAGAAAASPDQKPQPRVVSNPAWVYQLALRPSHRPAEIIVNKTAREAREHLRPGDTVVAPTHVKVAGVSVPSGHYGVVAPNGEIYHFHGYAGNRARPGGKVLKGDFRYDSAQAFADGFTADGEPAQQDRAITILRYPADPVRAAHFATMESFTAFTRKIEATTGSFCLSGSNNCRGVAKRIAFNENVSFRHLLPW